MPSQQFIVLVGQMSHLHLRSTSLKIELVDFRLQMLLALFSFVAEFVYDFLIFPHLKAGSSRLCFHRDQLYDIVSVHTPLTVATIDQQVGFDLTSRDLY